MLSLIRTCRYRYNGSAAAASDGRYGVREARKLPRAKTIIMQLPCRRLIAALTPRATTTSKYLWPVHGPIAGKYCTIIGEVRIEIVT